jgi:predicted nuclease of predicted toxin-antitoxin system
MLKFLIDEDMPRSTMKSLKAMGYEALDVRDCGFKGASDEEIFKFAQQVGAVILTGDVGFGNLFRFPIGNHCGIFIAHFPNEVSTPELNKQLMKALETLTDTDFDGNLIILEPGRIRIRRK